MQSAPKSRLESFAVIEAVANRLEESPALLRRRWPAEAKRRILEETLAPGVNVSAVARAHGVSPQQLFAWRRKRSARVRLLFCRIGPRRKRRALRRWKSRAGKAPAWAGWRSSSAMRRYAWAMTSLRPF
ncbi:hypothetical protein EN859_033530 [Mesorhizobium sp. M00.F.Ca.ET.216.01.1.1]|nr:hypothetical protein EN859_033530 [Mesorhizobium sp. M00.F.Ca.ET.216.01.1.1]